MSQDKSLKLTLEEGRKALGVHVLEKGHQLRQKYGHFIDFETIKKILKDEAFVRYPTTVVFDSTKLHPGTFGTAQRLSDKTDDGYVIYIHEHFKDRLGDVPALVLYQLVVVNYGDFATYNEAEEFGSAVLGMDKEYYYQTLCRLVDSISKKEKKLCSEE